MRTCSLGYCTDIVWLSIIVIWSLCLTLWKSHFIFSLGFNLFCAPRKFFHSVTFTAAFSAFFFFLFSNGAQRHNTSRRAFFFHFHLKMETLKNPSLSLPSNRANVPILVVQWGSVNDRGTLASLLMQQLPQLLCTACHTNQQSWEIQNGRIYELKAPFSLCFSHQPVSQQSDEFLFPRAASDSFSLLGKHEGRG